ncbi:MAG: type II secretion system F family protein [Sphingomonadales bacterium]|jgi:tight adherence protein C
MSGLLNMISFEGGSIQYYALLACIFAAIIFVTLALQSYMASRYAVRRRIEHVGVEEQPPVQLRLRDKSNADVWSRFIDKVAKSDLMGDPKNISLLRQQMVKAGVRSPAAPYIFILTRTVLAIGLPATYLYFSPELSRAVDIANVLFVALILLAFGLYSPKLWLMQRIAKREREIINAFPDALDLMTVCVEAGLGIDASFNRVGKELWRAHPLLSEEFAVVAVELRAGQSREEALRRMAERTGVEELRSFVALLIQSDKLGASVAQSLNVYSAEMREKRMMRAEEKAHRLPVLLTVPLMFFILPVMVGAVLLPGIIVIIRKVLPALYGNIEGS